MAPALLVPIRLLILFCFCLQLSTHAVEAPRRVLMIHSFGRDFAPFDEMASRFRTELARQLQAPVEFTETSLEMARFDGAEKDKPLLDFLTAIYAERPPDLVVPVGAPAAIFCQRRRAALFPTTPMLVVGADKRRLQGTETEPRFAAVGVELGLPALLENMLSVLPETRHVHVLMGSAPLERFWEGELKREWTPLAPQIAFHWLSDRSVEQLRHELRSLPPHSVIFVGILNRDAAGIPYLQESALSVLHEVAGAPIFGCVEGQLGKGIVGGRLLPMKQVGETAAGVASDILNGKAEAKDREIMLPLNAPVYDWRELKRWDIPEAGLPAGSAMLFRDPSLWESHRAASLMIAAVVAVQTVLIALLFAVRRRARESEARLRLTVEAANLGVWMRSGREGEPIEASLEWRRLFGLPENGSVGVAEVLERIHPEDRSVVRQAIEQAMHRGRSYDLEHRIVLPDGNTRWIASRGRVEPGNHILTRGVSMDITDRKWVESELAGQRTELAHLSRVSSLGVLSGALAHELNQPLAIILSNAQAAQHLLEAQEPDLNEIREILADIVSEDRRAGDVIRRLRALLRRGESASQPLDVNEVFQEVLRLMRSDLIRRGAVVNFDFAKDLPLAMSDRVQLQQVLLNLILNAFDAMESTPPAERVLSLRTALDGEMIRLSVGDRGVGLPEDVDALFRPFHTTKAQGLGLGLAICRALIDSHGGRLWAEANPDRGATFHVALTRAPEDT